VKQTTTKHKERKAMNHEFDEPAKGLAQSVTRQHAPKQFRLGLAGLMLACSGLAQGVQAQTSIVCDPAGDTVFGSGKGGPAVPPWLDILQAEITTDSGGNLLFTLTVNAPVPVAPAWKGVDDGGQLWWGYRLVGDLATDTTVKSGCIKPPGGSIPEGYFVDLIWDVTTSSFQARLLDDTTCAQSAIPFVFSTDRTQVTMVVPQSLLSNAALIPDPSNFQFLAATQVWKANSTGNTSFSTVDLAPNSVDGQLVAVNWSATTDNTYFCH
jgi:hypothetical protein